MKKLNETDVKVGSPLEALWTRVQESRIQQIKQLEEALIIEKEILKLSTDKLKEEQERLLWQQALNEGKSLTQKREELKNEKTK